jgi:hypothetical protein
MRVNEVTFCGSDAKKPQVRVQMGAVYSQDPNSENKSFAQYTPSASLTMNIDAGRPAADVFKHGQEVYVDLTVIGVPERTYIKDAVPTDEKCRVVLETVEGKAIFAGFNKESYPRQWTVDGEEITTVDLLIERGFCYWRYLKDGER